MVDFSWALTASIIGFISLVIIAIKQKHFVKKGDAVGCGLTLFIIALGLIFENPSLKLWQLPLYAYPLIQSLLGIGLVAKNEDLGKIILSGWASVAMGAIILIVQISN